jgi:hypothetical protein
VVAAADQVLYCDLGGEVAILNLKNGFFYGLTGEFEDPDRAMVAAPSAHAMRRSLQSALLCLHSNDHL